MNMKMFALTMYLLKTGMLLSLSSGSKRGTTMHGSEIPSPTKI